MHGQVAGGDLRVVERWFVGGETSDVESRVQVEVGRDLAELEVEVDEQNLLSRKSGADVIPPGEQQRGVDRQGGGPDAALG